MRFLRFLLLYLLAGALGAAQLSFEQTLKELHLKPDAEDADVDFPFVNNTGKTITIGSIETSCSSCLRAVTDGNKMTYQPGEKGVVRLNFTVGNFTGTVEKTTVLHLKTGKDPAGDVVLTTRMHIPELLLVNPKTLIWQVGEKPEGRRISLKVAPGRTLKVTGVTTGSEMFKVEMRVVKEGSEYELTLTPAQTERPAIGIVRVQTDSPIRRHQQLQAFGVVRAKAQ